MFRAQRLEEFLHRRGQGVVSRLAVDPQRVAAGLRHLHAVQDRAARRDLDEGVVGVHVHVAGDLRLLRVLLFLDFRLLLETRNRAAHLHLAEGLGETHVLFRFQRLIAKKQHHVMHERVAELLLRVVVERLRDVETVNECAECAADRLGVESAERRILTLRIIFVGHAFLRKSVACRCRRAEQIQRIAG